jgi:GNAT superfamily N-acetyltransferase
VLPSEVGDPWPDAGEVYELYVDPAAQGRGGGARLLEGAEDWLAEAGYGRAELSTLAANERAQAFYEARGWTATGQVDHVDLGVVAFDEVRYARSVGRSPP